MSYPLSLLLLGTLSREGPNYSLTSYKISFILITLFYPSSTKFSLYKIDKLDVKMVYNLIIPLLKLGLNSV
ncbi:Cytochrome P450 [Cordyceps militaris]|uniref:Cytochrome P450 n=1 Tax=Cordyceps militaris TaxID=73501 RepID=A0A2H4SB10_CORMI|nr:Cytochrome P450 [Cordyceps militaris]